jgi:hypothetical protein
VTHVQVQYWWVKESGWHGALLAAANILEVLNIKNELRTRHTVPLVESDTYVQNERNGISVDKNALQFHPVRVKKQK